MERNTEGKVSAVNIHLGYRSTENLKFVEITGREKHIFISQGCCNQWQQTGCLEVTELYPEVPEARGQKPRCEQACAPSQGSRADPGFCLFQLLMSPGVPWLVASSFQPPPPWPRSSSLSFPLSSLMKTRIFWFRANLIIQEDLISKWLTSFCLQRHFPK